MNIKKWEVCHLDKDRAARLAEEYAIPFFLAMLLDIRGLTQPEDIQAVLGGEAPLSDPFQMKGMDQAVERIRQAIEGFERIAVYGDYDADGVTATAMLYTYLEAVGADVLYYIPQREWEGYGMNRHAVETLHQEGVKLIITVDNGISSLEEVALARELGMDVVITDHHRPHESLPDAAALIDAHQPGDQSPCKDLSGAGVVLKLLTALEDGDSQGILEEYADLAALGTIGDVVPLLGENRTIVKAGLRLIGQGGRPGVDALLEQSAVHREPTATTLAFTAIPRINATGRMGAPERAVRLLTCEEEEDAAGLAAEICGENDRRRQVEAQIAQEAMARIEADPQLRHSRVLVVDGEGWHHGVIGIVASRITERYGKPCFVISVDGEEARGSGRSVEGFSLFEAVSSCGDFLLRFGGHPMAAGATMRPEDVGRFREGLNEYAKQHCPQMPVPVLRLDCRLNPASLSPEMPRALERLEPFGSGNPQPLFGLYGMELRDITPVGNGGHLRLSLVKNGAALTCMRFGMTKEDFPYTVGERLDLAVTLELREFRGEQQLTVAARDVKLSGLDLEGYVQQYQTYEKYLRRESLTALEAAQLTPSREELAALYRYLAAHSGGTLGFQSLTMALAPKGFGLGKLLLGLDMLEERGLAKFRRQGERLGVQLLPTQGKVDIFASPVFQKLRELAEAC